MNLEEVDSNIMVLSVSNCLEDVRIINIRRSFNPQNNVTPRDKFKYQIQVMKEAMTSNVIIVSDFNLDYEKVHNDNYAHKNLFNDFEEEMLEFNLVQLVRFPTWSRIVGMEI